MKSNYELIITNIDIPFKMFEFEGKNGNYLRENHWHRSIEILAIFDGELTIGFPNKEHQLKAGQFMLINSNQVHWIKASHPNQTVILQIPLKTFERYYTEEQFILFSQKTFEQDSTVMTYVSEIYKAYNCKDIGYEFHVQSLFYALLNLLVSVYIEQNVDVEMFRLNKKIRRLTNITNYIRDNYKSDLSLDYLAKVFGYSPTYLSRMFQKYGGINYKSFLRSIRLEYGFQELSETDRTISDIAMNNGFPNSKSFSAAFKERYGMMPSEYRNKKRQEIAIE